MTAQGPRRVDQTAPPEPAEQAHFIDAPAVEEAAERPVREIEPAAKPITRREAR